MITFKATVSPYRKADGTYPVKIRLTFKRKSRYLPTTVTVTDADITRSRKIKNSGVLAATNKLCDDLRALVGKLSPFTIEAWEIDSLVNWIKAEQQSDNFTLDFIQYGEELAKRQAVSVGKQTVTALRAFSRYCGGPCDINDITASMLQGFVTFVENENKISHKKESKIKKRPGVTVRIHITRLAAVYKAARLEFNDDETGVIRIKRDPFPRVQVKKVVHNGQRNLGVEVMQRIISAQTDSRVIRRSLDAFVVSFALMGANVADLWAAGPTKGSTWKYERSKTRGRRRDRARMEVEVPDCLAPYIERLQDGSGRRWLDLPGKSPAACGQLLNRGLKQWCDKEGIEPFTMYAARHSWASIARSRAVGIDKATVDDCLNHVSMALADIYIDKDFSVFAEANKKVLALFSWEGQKKVRKKAKK